jgi:hypothetical protein
VLKKRAEKLMKATNVERERAVRAVRAVGAVGAVRGVRAESAEEGSVARRVESRERQA